MEKSSHYSELENEINQIWSRPFEDSPVTKDLPRLAARINVEGRFGPPPKNPQKKQTTSLTDGFLTEIPFKKFFPSDEVKALNIDPETLEKCRKSLEQNYYFFVDGSLLLISDEQWRDFGVPDSLATLLKTQAAKVKTVQKQLDAQLTNKRNSHPQSLRLSFESANAIKDSFKKDKLEVIEEPEEQAQTKDDRNRAGMKEVTKVMLDVAERLEEPSKVTDLKAFLDTVLAKEKFADLELEVVDIFKVLGETSKTAKIFQAVHQNIIFSAVYQLKIKLPTLALTRDVRTREGWRINISCSNNVIVVAHRRREQSLATAGPEEQFWFEWELRMYFDQQVTTLHSAMLRITDLGFGDAISNKKREELKKLLSSGNMIIS